MDKSTRYRLVRPVFFVGFMGAGKTSVSRKIARSCGIASVDMDTYIERRVDRSIKDIFAEEGEDTFRALETDTLVELTAKDEPLLISCGGGVVVRPESVEVLRQSGTVVYLQVDADEAASRISNTESRPLFQNLEAARELCQQRVPLYESVSDITVDTRGKTVWNIAREVRTLLEKEGILCPISH